MASTQQGQTMCECLHKVKTFLDNNLELEATTPGWARNLERALRACWPNPGGRATASGIADFFQALKYRCSFDLFVACCCCYSRNAIDCNEEVIGTILSLDTRREAIRWPSIIHEFIRKYGALLDGSDPDYERFFERMLGGDPNLQLQQADVQDAGVPQSPQSNHDSDIEFVTGYDASAALVMQYLRPFVTISPVPLLKDIDRTQWEPYTSIPELIETSRCWEGPLPTSESLRDSMLDFKNQKGVQYRVGLTGVTFNEAMHEFHEADQQEIMIFDIPSTNWPKLQLPPDNPRSQSVKERRSDFTSRGFVFEFHMDSGTNFLSAAIDAVKVWFMAPPSPHNLKTLLQSYQLGCFQLQPDDYDGCVMIPVGAKEVLHLPAGTIYAEVTLKKGFFTEIAWYDEQDVRTAFACVFHTLATQIQNLDNELQCCFTILEAALQAPHTSRWHRLAVALFKQHKDELKATIWGSKHNIRRWKAHLNRIKKMEEEMRT